MRWGNETARSCSGIREAGLMDANLVSLYMLSSVDQEEERGPVN